MQGRAVLAPHTKEILGYFPLSKPNAVAGRKGVFLWEIDVPLPEFTYVEDLLIEQQTEQYCGGDPLWRKMEGACISLAINLFHNSVHIR